MKAAMWGSMAMILAAAAGCGQGVGLEPLEQYRPEDTGDFGVDIEDDGLAPEFLTARASCEWGWDFQFQVYLDDPEGLQDITFVGVTIEKKGLFGGTVDEIWLLHGQDPHVWWATLDSWDTPAECGDNLAATFEAIDSWGRVSTETISIQDRTW